MPIILWINSTYLNVITPCESGNNKVTMNNNYLPTKFVIYTVMVLSVVTGHLASLAAVWTLVHEESLIN